MLIRLIRLPPTISGTFKVMDACATQKALPATENTNISIERSSVCFVVIALKICGTRISVHKDEAAQPNITSNSNLSSLIYV